MSYELEIVIRLMAINAISCQLSLLPLSGMEGMDLSEVVVAGFGRSSQNCLERRHAILIAPYSRTRLRVSIRLPL